MATRPVESFTEHLSRVELMADGDMQWDLSENDIAAIRAILKDRARLQGVLDQIQAWIDDEQLPSSVLGGRVYNLIRPSRAASSRPEEREP